MTKDGALNKDLDTPTPSDKRAIASAEETKKQVDGIKKKLASGEKIQKKEKPKKEAAAPAAPAAPAKEAAPAAPAKEATPAKEAEL